MTELKFLVRVLDQANYLIPAAAVFTGVGVSVSERGTLGENELIVFQNRNIKPPYQIPTILRLGVCGVFPVPPREGASEETTRAYYARLRRETVLPSQTGTGPGQKRYPTYPAALLTHRLPVEASNWQGLTPTQHSYELGPHVYLFASTLHSCPRPLSDLFNVWRVTDIHVRPYS
jgi:hypothetical protein